MAGTVGTKILDALEFFKQIITKIGPNIPYHFSPGADPNGNEKNLCTPLAVMSQRGYYEGIGTLLH